MRGLWWPCFGPFLFVGPYGPALWAGLRPSRKDPLRALGLSCARLPACTQAPRQQAATEPARWHGVRFALWCILAPRPARSCILFGKTLTACAGSFHFVPPRGHVSGSRMLSIARPLLRSSLRPRATCSFRGRTTARGFLGVSVSLRHGDG